ncbi:hypothetical protein [Companilactobacillus sp. HBUAS59544]|uniref:hypothetical protein n=1 Tax=Companilactobacillus sp. HBUAS59544 TaxID=3109363 RepID=UPI002FF33BA2
MKKNVKYIGSAVAVALLAAGAPVVIPMLNPTNVVAAETYDKNMVHGDIDNGVIINSDDAFTKAYFTAFKNQFANQFVSDSSALITVLKGQQKIVPGGSDVDKYGIFSYFDPDNPAKFKDFQDDGNVKKLKNPVGRDAFENSFETEYGNIYYFRDILASIEVVDANGNQVMLRNSTDYDAAIKNLENGSIPFPMTFYVKLSTDENESEYSPHTLDRLNKMDPSLTNFKFTLNQSTFNVDRNDSNTMIGTSISNLDGSGNSLSVTDKYTSDNGDSKEIAPTLGKSLFSSKADAIKYAGDSNFDANATDQGESGVVDSDGTIAKSGTYYQTVSYNIKNDNDEALTAMINGTNDPNTNQTVATYPTWIKSNGSSSKGTEGTDFVINKSKGLLTLTRLVSVTGSASPVFATPEVSVGSSTDDDALTSTLGDVLKDDAQKDIDIDGVTFDNNYFLDSSAKDAVGDDFYDEDGKFAKAGTFYRKITYNFSNNVSGMNFSPKPYAKTDNSVTYIQPVKIVNSATKNITTANVGINDSIDSTKATGENEEGNENTLVNENGSLVNTKDGYSGVSFGTSYYKYDPDLYNSDSAYSNALNKEVINNEGTTTDVVDENGNFVKSGDYLRTITFYLIDGAVDTNTFGTDTSSYKVDKDNGTVTYIQKVHIAPAATIKATVNYDVPNVLVGTNNTNSALTSTNGDTLTIANGNATVSIIDTTKGTNGIEFGSDYYTDNNLQSDSQSGFPSAGTYYRKITFYLNRDVSTLDFGGLEISTNTSDNSVTFVQAINAVSVVVNNPLKTINGQIGKQFGNNNLVNTPPRLADSTGEMSLGMRIPLNKQDLNALYGSPENALYGIDKMTNEELDQSNKFINAGTFYRTITYMEQNGTDFSKLQYSGQEGVDYLIDGDNITFVQTINVKDNRNPTVTNIGTVNAKVGENVDSVAEGVNSITSDDESIINDAGTTVGNTYYKNAEDVLSDTDPQGSTFTTSGTYYRAITFTLNDTAGSVNDYAFEGVEDTDYKIDSTNNTVTMVQKVNVSNSIVENIDTATANVGDEVGAVDEGNSTITNNGISIIKGTKVGSDYYNSAPDALSGNNSQGTTFESHGTYWRTITFTLTDVAGSAKDYAFEGIEGKDYLINSDGTVTMAQPIEVSISTVKSDIISQTVQNGSLISDSEKDTPDLTVNGKSVVKKDGVSYGTDYYDASNESNTAESILSGQGIKDPDVTNGTNFAKAGSYYRVVTFTLNIDGRKYDFDNDGFVSSDGKTVTYLQPITINKISTTTIVPDVSIGVGVPVSTIRNKVDGIELIDNLTKETLKVDNIGTYAELLAPQNDINVYFSTADDARSFESIDPSKAILKSGNSTFDKAGTYYRLILFKVSDDTLSNYKFDSVVNGETPIVDPYPDLGHYIFYVQKVNVTDDFIENIDTVSASVGDDVKSVARGKSTITANGKSIIDDDKTTVGSDYYASATDALNESNSLGTTFKGTGDFYRTITFTLLDPKESYDFDGTKGTDYLINSDGTVTMAQPVEVRTSSMEPEIKSQSVSNGSLVSDSEKDVPTLKVNNNSVVQDNGVIFGTNYYDMTDTTNNKIDILSGNGKADSNVVAGNSFAKAGQYYRVITFKLKEGIDGNQYALNGGHLNSDGTVSYVQEVDVKANSTFVKIPNIVTNTGVPANSFTNKDGYDVTSANNSIVGGIDFGNYYENAVDAVSGDTSKASSNVANNAFKKNQIFYRTVTFTLKSDASNYDFSNLPTNSYKIDGNKISFAQEVDVENNPATAKIYPAQGKLNGSTADSEKAAGSVLYVTNADGTKENIFDKVTFGPKYYTDSDLDNEATNEVVNGKFIKAGTYYREIIFHINNNSIDAADFKGSDAINIDTENKTVSFVQAVNVLPSTTTVNVHNLTVNVGSSTNITDTDGDSLVDSGNNSLIDDSNNDGITFGSTYYTNPQSALIDDGKTDAVKVGDNFTTSGQTYYRTITFKLNDEAKNYTFTDLVNGVGSKSGNGTVTFVQAVTVNKSTVTANISKLGNIKVGDSKATEESKDSLLDADGNSIVSGNPDFGETYYDSNTDALNSMENSDTKSSSGINADGVFVKSGTYYRTITFNLLNPASEYNFAGKEDTDYVITDGNKITYVQSVTVSANPTTATIPDLNVGVGTGISSISNNQTGIEVIDNITEKSLINGISIDPNLYESAEDAYSETSPVSVKADDQFTDTTKSYYRRVTITLSDLISNHDFTDIINGESPVISEKGNTVTYIQKINVVSNAVSEKIDTAFAKIGDDISNVIDSGTNSLTINNGEGLMADVKTGDEFYTSSENAIKNIDGSTEKEKFAKAGVYYRRITFTLKNPASSYTFNGKNNINYSINGNTVTFAQKIVVGSIPAVAQVKPLVVDAKTLINDDSVTGNKGYTVTGATLEENGIGTTYYKSLNGALNQDKSDIDDSAVSDGYLNPGNYYRLLYFTPGTEFNDDYVVSDDNMTKLADGTIIYAQPVTVRSATDLAQVSISSGKADVGDKAKDVKVSGSKLTDSKGNTISNNPTYGKNYYVNAKDVFKENVAPTVSENGTFNNSGLYYRSVTFTLSPENFAKNNFGSDAYLNAQEYTVSFVQPIYVGVTGVKVHVDPLNISTGTSEESVKETTGTLTDTAGKTLGSVANDGVGTTYYKSAADALNGNASTTAVDDNGNFNKGQYYRLITFDVSDGVNLNDGYLLNDDNAKLGPDGTKVYYAQEINVTDNDAVSKYNVSIAKAKVGQNITSVTDNPTENKIYDANGQQITDAKVLSYGDQYYDEAGDVFTDGAKTTSEIDADGNFTKAGTYYRKITFQLTPAEISANNFGTNAHVDKENSTVSYVQTVVVSANETAKITADPLTVNVGTSIDAGNVTNLSLLKLEDANGKSLVEPEGTKIDNSKFYSNVADALDNSSKVANATEDAKFLKGDFYRVITFTPTDKNFAKDYDLHDANAKVNADGTITYAQLIHVVNSSLARPNITVVNTTAGNSDALANMAGNVLYDQDGNTISISVTPGSKYYTDSSNVLKGVDPVSITKPRTYYREITFKVSQKDIDNNTFGTDALVGDGTVSYVQTVVINSAAAHVSVAPIDVITGTSTSDTKLTSTDGYSLNNKTDSIPASVSVDNTYYANAKAARTDDKSGVVDVGDTFTTPGTYYRRVTFTPSVKLDSNSFADPNVVINSDGTVTYVQTINVSAAEKYAQTSVSDLDVSVDTKADPKLMNTDYTLTDSDNNSLLDPNKNVEVGSDYYLKNDLTDKTDLASGNRVYQAGTYFRQVKFYLADGAADNINNFAAIGGTYDKTDNSVTFVQKVVASTTPANYIIADTSVDYGTSVRDSSLNNPGDVSITGSNNDAIVANNGVQFGDFYTDSTGTTPATNIDSNGKFTKAGTYYQRVTVKLVDNGTNAYTFSGENVSVDPDNNTVTFIRAVTVKEASSTGGSTGGNTGGGSTGTGGNSGNSGSTSGTGSSTGTDDTWVYTDKSGVVTTKTDRQMYGLNNQNNDRITNRNLAENTSWKYDQIRTNESGVKQYRVATGEWIDANDVYLGYPQTNQDDDWIYTDVSGIVTTKTNQRQYQLNDQANDVISSRNLKKDTSWKTDQYRTNKAGVQQYRVATGEWVDANDVIFGQNQVAVDDAWTYANIDGIITTKTDQTTYDLDNQDNELIKGRQLVQDTSWKTDQVRTNRAGIKQYRVATGEWVDSNAVFFEEPVETGVFKNAVGVKGIINLDRTSTVYRLYSKEDELIDDYSLAQETSWRTDYRVEDSNGDTYYHVGNDEWIKLVKGVHFNTYAWY